MARDVRTCRCQRREAQLDGMGERLVLVSSSVREVQDDPSASDIPGERKRFQRKTARGGLVSFALVAPVRGWGK